MPRSIPEARLAELVSLVEKHPEGAAFLDLAAGLKPPFSMRTAERWVNLLVKQGRLMRTGKRRAARYKVPPPVRDPASVEPPAHCSPLAQSIHRLVTAPMEERMEADYERRFLDRYCPGQTFYLPYEARVEVWNRLNTGKWWNELDQVDRTAAALVSRILALEQAFAGLAVSAGVSGRPPLSEAEIVASLGGGQLRDARPELQLAWNVRDVLFSLGARTPKAPLSWKLLNEVYAQVTAKNAGLSQDPLRYGVASVGPKVDSPCGPSTPPLLRALPLVLPHTSYFPRYAPLLLRGCFEQVLRTAMAITDAIEQSFFLLVHLLYLQPFGRLNAAMALVTMNVPLLAVGGAPLTFSGSPPSDLIAAIRGVWELNRPELLADVYTGVCRAKT